MINVKPPEEAKRESEVLDELNNLMLTPTARYLKEISITLKDILREMRKRKG